MKRRDFIKVALPAGGGIGAGALYLQAPALAGADALPRQPDPVDETTFNVRRFEAKGDGRADDTAAAQRAIDAAVANRGGRVHFPAGRYRITRSLVVKSTDRFEITGDGFSSVLFHENDEPLLVWPEGSMCVESSVRHLCFTSSVNHKSRDTAVIAFHGGAARSLFSHLLFNTARMGEEKNGYLAVGAGAIPAAGDAAAPVPGEPVNMGSGIFVDRVMDTTTLEHCLMWGPVRGTGIRVAEGSEVRIIGGRIIGAANPFNAVGKDSIGVHLTGNNGGVHLVTTDLIGLGTGLKIGEEGMRSNREIFITHATFDSSVHGIVQVDNAYTSISGCWAASCDEEQILMTESALGALMMINGGTIFNGGAYGRPGTHHGMVVRAGSFMLNGVAIRNNKGTGLLVQGESVRDYAVTGCRINDNGVGVVLAGDNYAVTGNVFSRNGQHLVSGVSGNGVVANNVGLNAAGAAENGKADSKVEKKGNDMSTDSNSTGKNSVMVLHPYKQHPDSPIWVFDDPRHDLVAEPFVGQVNDMMDRLLESKGISTAGKPYAFSMFFSANPLPDYDLHLEWVSGDTRNESGEGNIYRSPDYGIEGWLCPALFCYFAAAPKDIYIKMQPGKG